MKPQLTGDRWTGAPPLIWSACSWCPDGRSWHQPGLAGHRTWRQSSANTAWTGRHPGGVPGGGGETHPALSAYAWSHAPKHDGVWVYFSLPNSTTHTAQRWWWPSCLWSFGKRMSGRKWAGSSSCVDALERWTTTHRSSVGLDALLALSNASNAFGVAAPLLSNIPYSNWIV